MIMKIAKYNKIFVICLTLVLIFSQFFVSSISQAKAEELPDLTIEDVSFSPRNPYKDEKFTGQIRIQVKNIGQAEAVDEDTIGIKIPFKITTLSQDDFSLVELYSMDNYVNNISVGESVEITIDIIDLDFNVEGIHLVAWADSDAIRYGNGSLLENNNLSINETNEDNNTFIQHIILTKNSSVVCIDSDGSRDYYTQGRIDGIDTWGEKSPTSSFVDSCISSKKLNEVYCGDEGYVYTESFECFYGCENGACLSQSKPEINTALTERLKGKILLQVEDRGQIWYVNPDDSKKYEVTFGNVMKLFEDLALGISNNDLNQILVNPSSESENSDRDGDGYNDKAEAAYGYNPDIASDPNNRGNDKIKTNTKLSNRLMGKLLLQVEDRGRIWYIDQATKRWEVTFGNVMNLFTSLALGITNQDLSQITAGN
ncbi:MAG: hypothetical protein ABIJ91_05295 [Candidatus Kuenenbacteria bacterium]